MIAHGRRFSQYPSANDPNAAGIGFPGDVGAL